MKLVLCSYIGNEIHTQKRNQSILYVIKFAANVSSWRLLLLKLNANMWSIVSSALVYTHSSSIQNGNIELPIQFHRIELQSTRFETIYKKKENEIFSFQVETEISVSHTCRRIYILTFNYELQCLHLLQNMSYKLSEISGCR